MRPAYSGFQRASSTLPRVLHYWTWREAVEVASRLDASGRITLRREGDRWVVRYHANLRLVNVG